MIVRKIRLQHWKQFVDRQFEFQAGLNVIAGDNERGKSTLVEAIRIGLFTPFSEGARLKNQLDPLVPISNALGVPTLDLELEVDDAMIQLSKSAGAKPSQRRTILQVHRHGGATERLEGREADSRIAELLGQFDLRQSIGLSQQVAGHAYLGEPLPESMIASLTLDGAGAILPSRRLGAIGSAVGELRSDVLQKKLAFPLREAAKAQTVAGNLNVDLKNTAAELDKARNKLQRVEQVRLEIGILRSESEARGPQLETAEKDLAELRSRRHAQSEADKAVAAEKSALAAAQREVEKLSQLQSDAVGLDRSARDLETQSAVVKAEIDGIRTIVAEEEAAGRDLRKIREATEAERADCEQRLTVVIARNDWFENSERLESAREQWQQMTEAVSRYATIKAENLELGPWLGDKQIGALREKHRELEQFLRDARTQLQFDFTLQAAARVRFVVDSALPEDRDLPAETSTTIQAVCSLRVEIDGVGIFHVRCGAAELQDLLREIERRTNEIDDILAPHGVATSELPAGFRRIEERRIRGQEIQNSLRTADAELKDLERRFGTLDKLEKKIADLESQTRGAATRLGQLGHAPQGALTAEARTAERETIRTLRDQLLAELDIHKGALEDLRKKIELSEDRERKLMARLSSREGVLQSCQTQLAEVVRRRGELAAKLEFSNLEADLESARRRVYQSEIQLAQAEGVRRPLGTEISELEIASRETALRNHRLAHQEKSIKLSELSGELRSLAGDDPVGAVESLEDAVGQIEKELAIEERRLEGVVLLDHVLAAARARLAKRVATPLNERIGGWLEELRGLPTELEVNETDCRIVNVVTRRGGSVEKLPFAQHSEGFKGQLALLVRLALLKSLVARDGRRRMAILDDPLTETSPARLKTMMRVLANAALDLQILFATCHSDIVPRIGTEVHVIEV